MDGFLQAPHAFLEAQQDEESCTSYYSPYHGRCKRQHAGDGIPCTGRDRRRVVFHPDLAEDQAYALPYPGSRPKQDSPGGQ